MKYLLAWIFLPSIALAATSGFTVGFQTSDSDAPTVPTNLTATAVSNSQINLSWTASTDTFGVSGYRVFRDSVFLATSTVTTYSDTGLTASTTYSYTVSAFDAALNISAHSATATATTTDTVTTVAVTTTTTSGGSAGGGCRPCHPCDRIRLNCDSGGIFLPIAVNNLQISSSISRLVLQWDNPVLSQFVGVRIIRSEKGFPQDAYDGALIFEGLGNVFVDRNVLHDKNYYYGVFAMYAGNVFASPAIVFGSLSADQALGETGTARPDELFTLPIFNFKQNGVSLDVVDGIVSAEPELPIEVYLSGDVLPKEARLVVLDLSDATGSVGSWVMVYDRETGSYRVVLPVFKPGNFFVTGTVYDHNFNILGTGGQSELRIVGSEQAVLVGGSGFGIWWLWIILLLLLALLYRLLRQHSYEKGT